MDKATAAKIVKLNLESIVNLNKSISIVKQECSDELFDFYRKRAAKAIALISFELLEPIFKKYPDLKDYE